jgi:hypothetical protein
VPRKDKAADDKSPRKLDEKPGHETVDAAFDDIIDAILNADPEAVREHQQQRRRRRKPDAK